MKVGDLVKQKGNWVAANPWMKDTGLDDSPERFGIIIEVWLDDDHWGDTAVVEWLDGFKEEITADNLEVINV